VQDNWYDKDKNKGLAQIAHHLLKERLKCTGKNQFICFDEADKLWKRGNISLVCSTIRPKLKYELVNLKAYFTDTHHDHHDNILHEIDEVIAYTNRSRGILNVAQCLASSYLVNDMDPHFERVLDNVPYLIGVQNGVVDLRTGQLRQRVKEDNIYNVLKIAYDPHADSTLMEETVHQIMAEDAHMVAYLHKLLGYAITGEVSENIFVIFCGDGRNGKGVLTQAIEHVMNGFFRNMNTRLITSKKAIHADYAKEAKGARIAVFNHIEGQYLRADKVQLLSGGDDIPNQQLCILSTSEPPKLDKIIPDVMQRIICIPFPVNFVTLNEGERPSRFVRECRIDLKSKLKSNPTGILKWLVNGAVKWYASKDLRSNAPSKVQFMR